MAKRKSQNFERRLSLFDYVASQKELKQENEQENKLLEEVLYGIGQTDRTDGNSSQVFETGNNRGSVESRKLDTAILSDSRQVGIEQSRRFGELGTSRDYPLLATPNEPMGIGREDNELGTILRHGDGWDEQVGDFQGYGSEHRTLVQNYRITADDNIGKGGAKLKFQDNMNAITLLHFLRSQNTQYSTKEEQKILAKYVGWGGISQAFDKNNTSWEKEYTELKNLLSEEEYTNARRSTQDAHYTSETVINAMYQGLERLGIGETEDKLKIIESSAGIGNFLGLKPDTVNARFYTVEQDNLSASILNYLYPEENNIKESFQNVDFGASVFDVAIGNPPFGNQKLFDKNFPQLSGFSIHNYFIAKSMDLVKEGGVGAFVVSRYFMDSQNSTHREYIAEHSHFLGAVRLPSMAFKENALTEVTTDIVFFQKKTEFEKERDITKGKDWLNLTEQAFYNHKTEKEQGGFVNEYFADNPLQMLGKMEYSHGQFADELKCISSYDNQEDFVHALSLTLSVLPKNSFNKSIAQNKEQATHTEFEKKFIQSEYYQGLKAGSLLVIQGQRKIAVKAKDDLLQDSIKISTPKSDTAYARIVAMVEIRDTLRKQLNLEKSNASMEELDRQRKKLNIQYDNFVKRYGYLNSQTNRSLFKDDPESSLLQSLEINFDKGISKEQAQRIGKVYSPASASKATIFSKRVLEYVEPATSADSSLDALSVSLRESGTIDFARMADLLGKSKEDVQRELEDDRLIFKNPTHENWEIKDKYLTGNVKEKLKIAKAYAETNPEYQRNIEALQDVIPKDIEAVDIGVKFGSTWLPSKVINDFIDEKIGKVNLVDRHLEYIAVLGKWEIKLDIYDKTINHQVWGTIDYPADELIKSLLTNRSIKVEREVGRDDNNKLIKEIDQEATDVAMQKAEEIQQAFLDWIWENDERRENLTKIYNDRFNTHVVPHYDGSHIELARYSGASTNVRLRTHQKDVVWRSIQEGTALFDHVVGAGKTLAAIATIKESKRMGFIKKPMVVVPNHLVYQWRDEFYKLYPDANILVAEKTDFLKENRERFFSKVATGNWDAVIVAHSSFKKIDMPKDVQKEILQEQIDAIIDALDNVEKDNRRTIKQLEKQRERMEERYIKLLEENNTKDTSVDFSDLGVDALFVDESQEFKNLPFSTSMNVSGLGNITGSAKALDLFIKCRYLQKHNNGKGVYFLTGTPISNSIAEVFTMQRYMQYEELKAKDIEYFDAWASTFGKVTSKWELDSTGVGYKLKDRFANFENVPELLSMYRTFADVVTKSDIDEQLKKENRPSLTPSVKGGKPYNEVVERSPMQAEYMDDIIHRMEHLPKDPRVDNPLKITNDARKAGLDFRLIDPQAPDFPESKVNVCARRIYQIWQDSTEDRGTQLVFCDLSTPKGKRVTEKFLDNVNDNDNENRNDEIENIEFEDNEDIINMDEILAGLAGNGFSVYDDLKKKLIAKGIPNHEIAFIHDANTDLRKAKLFNDVNTGTIRILIGSTAKMGSGMNVQERLVSAHHLDAPWRPSDLEQRNGRIIRQGNFLYEKDPNFEVGIYYYATKQTYDARMWQTIEYKAMAIEQFRKGDVLQRTIEDISSEASNAAEMKAAASGNPLILAEVNLSLEKRKLEALFSQYTRSKHRLSDSLKYLQNNDKRFENAQELHKENITLRDRNTVKTIENGKGKIQLELYSQGKILTSKHTDELTKLFTGGAREAMQNRSKKVDFGKYRGFDVTIKYCSQNFKDGFRFILTNKSDKEYMSNNLIYGYDEKVSLTGLFQRLDNFLEKEFDNRLAKETLLYQREKEELPIAEKELNKAFVQDDDLKLVRENHSAVIRELKRMQEDNSYVSEWEVKTLDEFKLEKSTEKAILKQEKVNTVEVQKSTTLGLRERIVISQLKR